MDKRTDDALVSAALAGQGRAFAALVRKYQDYAYGAAIGILSDFDLARDVVQEAFLCAYRDLRKLREPARFPGWLHGIVRNTAHRALRELARVRTLAEELGHRAEAFAATPPPERSAEDAERRRLVRRALGGLSEKNREAVSLYYVDGLSYTDIAGFLGVTETTVQGRLQRGRAQLRKELAMVEKTFKEEELPEEFSAEIKRLLDAADAGDGREHQAAIRRLAEIGAPAVGPLCEALVDPRIPVRRAAACALCAIGDERALRPILRVLYREDYWTGNALLRTGRALAIPGVREELLKIVHQGQPGEQYWAVQALAHAKGDDEVYDSLSQVFRDPRSPIRHQALWALCELRPESGTALVTEALDAPDPGLRGSVGWIALLGGFLPPIEACLKAFEGGVRPKGCCAAGHLLLQHGEEGRAVLERLMRTGSEVERLAAAVTLAHVHHPEAFHVLRSELLTKRHDRKWLRELSRTLGWHYGPELAAWIEAERPDLSAAHALIWALARSRPEQAGGVAERLLRTGTPAVRAAAVRILARQKGAAFLPELRRCLRQGRPRKVAQEAFWQMFRLRDAAMPTVEEMLESDHWTERKAAFCLLRRWDKLTPEQKARGENDPHVAVRHAANWHPSWKACAKWHAKWKRKLGAANP